MKKTESEKRAEQAAAIKILYPTIIRQECTPADWKEIVKKAVEQAKIGDSEARAFLAGYLIGLPDDGGF